MTLEARKQAPAEKAVEQVKSGMALGLGGALRREKMVETAARRFVVIVDDSKLVAKLGSRGPLPVEVVQFGWRAQMCGLESMGCSVALRGGGDTPLVTDNGHDILDCTFSDGIDDPTAWANACINRAGVVEHGLFLGLADEVIVAVTDGVRSLKAS